MVVVHVARKPLAAPTVAENVVVHGAGGLHVDACRIPADYAAEYGDGWLRSGRQAKPDELWQGPKLKRAGSTVADRISDLGRWPSNLVVEHRPTCGSACADGCPALSLDEQGKASRFFHQVR